MTDATEAQSPPVSTAPHDAADAAPLKETSSVRQAWVTLAMTVFVCVIFAFVVMPYLGAKGSGLEGVDAPDFALEVMDPGVTGAAVGVRAGDRIKLSSLKGKAVVVDFWASWCEPCQEQMPVLDRVAEKRRNDPVVFLGVNTADSRSAAEKFLRERAGQGQAIGYPALFDESLEAKAAYGIDGLPTLIVIDRNGTITAARKSVVSERDLERYISQALGQ